MKFTHQLLLLIAVLFFQLNTSVAQEDSFTGKYKEQAIQRLSQLMNDFYVFPEVAKQTPTFFEVRA